MWILIAILALPIVEILLFVQFGPALGVFGTLIEIIATGALGLVLIRAEPQRNHEDLRQALAREESPASPLAHSALRLLGGVLLVLPGFFTDALGLALLLPPLRALLLQRFFLALRDTHLRSDITIIEGEYERSPPEGPHRYQEIEPPEPDRQKRD